LVMHVMYDEEEDPNAKRMHVVEEEVSLSQPETAAVPPEEDEVAVPQGPSIAVPPEEEVPPKEEEFPAPAIAVLQPPQSRSRGGRGGPNSPPYHGPAGRKGMPCPYIGLGKFFALLFLLKNAGDSSRPFFS
jgi:hypothetical protein